MTYSVKEMFYTLQGEGARAGRPAVFVRFAGCNLWSGREQDRAAAICSFCDTEFVGVDGDGGGKFESADALARGAAALWPDQHQGAPYLVCTGGEPLLQLDSPLIAAFQASGFEVAAESNGTIAAPPELDWICVSPKARADLVQISGDELKLVFPQQGADPARFEGLDFTHFFLQPMDGAEKAMSTEAAIAYCLAHPRWRLSLQTHKLLGLR